MGLLRDLRGEVEDHKFKVILSIGHLLLFIFFTGLDVWDLYSSWRVWVQFEINGISEEPLIPPKSIWVDAWLAFVVVGSLLAILAFVNGIVGLCFEGCQLFGKPRDEPGCTYGCNTKTREEILGFLYLLFKSLPIIILSYLYFIVQSSCKELNHINHVVLSEVATTSAVLFQIMRTVYWLCRRHGVCCDWCYHTNDREDPDTDEVCWLKNDSPPVCFKSCIVPGFFVLNIILELLVLISGVVALALTVDLVIQDDSVSDRLHVVRSDPSFGSTPLFRVPDLVENGTLSLTEEFIFEDGTTTYCQGTFVYDSDANEIFYNVANLDRNGTNCTCTTNHEQCNSFYDNLFYGFSEPNDSEPGDSDNFRPYECFEMASLLGIHKDNTPGLDTSIDVDCDCESDLTHRAGD